MALDLTVRYSGQVSTIDPGGYPYGKAQNVTVEGDGNGTPLEKDLVNDILGLQQALLIAAGITPSGTPDKANASQYLDAIKWIAEAARATFPVSNFGADPTGGVSSQTAIQNAISAAAVSGGIVWFGPGYFLYTGLSIPDNVSLKGTPGATYLALDHATNGALTPTQVNSGPETVVSDIIFVGNVANTGTCVENAVGARMTFIRCSFGSGLNGKLARVQTSASELTFLDCRLAVSGNVNGIEANDGRLRILGGKMSMPATYTASLVLVDNSANVELACAFDLKAHTTGSAKIAYNISTTALLTMHDCKVDATGMSGPVTGLAWTTGGIVRAYGNEWVGPSALTRFSTARAGAGSFVDLIPGVLFDAAASATIVIPDGAASVRITSGVSAAPTAKLPNVLYAGQPLAVSLFNGGGSTWSGQVAWQKADGTTALTEAGSAFAGLLVGQSFTMNFVAVEIAGALYWQQCGKVAVMA
jgi:hypothetical protein